MKNLKVLLAFFISAFMLPCTVLASDGGVAASIIKDPVVDTLFSIIIILSIVIEIKTAGFSGGSLIAILAGLILIGTNWYYEGGQSLEFALYFGGIALIILDILVMYTGIFHRRRFHRSYGRSLFYFWRKHDGSLYSSVCSTGFLCRGLFPFQIPSRQPHLAEDYTSCQTDE